MEKLKLSDVEKDALRECGNVGIGNAATSLSQLLNKRVGINIPETKFIAFEKFADELGGPENIVSSIYLEVNGDLKGEALFAFDDASAKHLVDCMMGNKPGTTTKIDELEESAIKEMSNIFIGSYLSSLGNMLDLKLLPSIPHTATDMAQAIVDFMLIKLAEHSDEILIVKEKIDVEGQSINGVFIVIFDVPSLRKMLEALHNKYGVL